MDDPRDLVERDGEFYRAAYLKMTFMYIYLLACHIEILSFKLFQKTMEWLKSVLYFNFVTEKTSRKGRGRAIPV